MLLELCEVTKKFSRRGREFNAVDSVSLSVCGFFMQIG